MPLFINEGTLLDALHPDALIQPLDQQMVFAFATVAAHDRKLTHENMREFVGLCFEGNTILSTLQVLKPVQRACTDDGHPLNSLTEGIPELEQRLVAIRAALRKKIEEMGQCPTDDVKLN